MLLLNESFLLCTYINLNTFETCVDCTRQVQSTPTATCAYSFLIQVQNSWQLVPVPGKASLNSVAPELEIGNLPNVIQMSGIAQLIANAFAKQTPLLLFLLLSLSFFRTETCALSHSSWASCLSAEYHNASLAAGQQEKIKKWMLFVARGSNFTINPAMQCLQSVSFLSLFLSTVQRTSVWPHQDTQRLLKVMIFPLHRRDAQGCLW